jgi:hypothetical protein
MPSTKKIVAKRKKSHTDVSKRMILRALAFSGERKNLAILEEQLTIGPGDKPLPVKAHVLKRS